MKEFKLRRIVEVRGGTLGLLEMPGNDIPNFVLEPLWKNNKRNISCIPVGTYVCTRENHHEFGDTYKIEIKSRPGVYFHRGNTPNDTEGCPIQGTDVSMLMDEEEGVWISESRTAFDIFKLATAGDKQILLTITNENKSTGQQDETTKKSTGRRTKLSSAKRAKRTTASNRRGASHSAARRSRKKLR